MATIKIGKRLVPVEHIALVEPFDLSENPKLRSDKPFKSRVVLLDRASLLSELEPLEFAQQHGFRWIIADQTATNPGVSFHVESFDGAASDGFAPKRSFSSRLLWRDNSGQPQSKLMAAEPEALLAICVRGLPVSGEPDGVNPPPAPSGRRARTRRANAQPN